LKFSLHTIQFTHFKCIIQVFLVNVELCDCYHIAMLEHFRHP
jgi:hypothetical protein